jgi:putative DNA primase/helicase
VASPQSPRIDLAELREALRDRLESLAETLLGPHNKARSRRTQWRWGTQGSLSLEIAGRKRGAWWSHESGEGGGPIELIQHVRRCSFADAVAWGADFTGLSRSNGADRGTYTAEAEQRRRQREREQAEHDAEAAADEQHRVENAQRLWLRTVPAPNLVDQYLGRVRGVPRPATGWPDAARFLPDRTVTLTEEGPNGRELRRTVATAGALVLAATLADGTLRGCQRVYLTAEADNLRRSDGGKVKLTLGALEGAAARLPGLTDGPLLLAEGPETGLSVWAATGHETHVALGSLGNLRPPPGRRIVLCRDDDPQHSPADRALCRTVEAWREAGIDVAIATPWTERRGDGSDFNDTIRTGGVDAVRARIMAALDPGPKPPHRVPVKEGRQAVKDEVAAFFKDAVARGKPAEDTNPPLARLVQIDTGGGKSDAARIAAAQFLAELRRNGDRRTVAMAVPTHALSGEQAQRFEALPEVVAAGLKCRIWRGRRAQNPAAPGQTMCRNLDLVREVQALKLDVPKRACANCRYLETCAYLGQREERADLWLVAHNMVFEAKPRALGDLAALIVDENPIGAALEGIDPRHPIKLPLAVLSRVDRIEGIGQLATDQLVYLRRLARDTLADLPDGPLPRAAFVAAGFLPNSAQEARRLEWQTHVDVELSPDMTAAERREALGAAQRNADLGRRVMFWTALGALLQPGGMALSGWASISTEDGEDGRPARVLALKGRREVAKRWQVPTLLLDATARRELLAHVWPGVRQTADIRLLLPHQRIRQTRDCAFALSRLDVDDARDDTERRHRAKNLRDLHAIICREARRYSGRVLVVAQERIETALQALGNLPANIELGHHNALRGRDIWGPNGKDSGVSALVVIGRTLPPSNAIARMGEALTGVAMPTRGYERATAWRELADGSAMACEAQRYPDAIGEALRWQACEAEVVQIIGRARGVNRGPGNPVGVLALTDVPLPLPVEVIPVAALDPSPDDLMLAAGGVVLTNATDAATAYPEFWRTREAAKSALQRAKANVDKFSRCRWQMGAFPYEEYLLIRECTHLDRVEYQKSGARFSRSEAWYDAAIVPDAVAWLFERLGELSDWNAEQPAAMVQLEPPPVPDDPAAIAAMSDADKLALRVRLQAGHPAPHPAGEALEVLDGYGDALASDALFPGDAACAPVAGLWTVRCAGLALVEVLETLDGMILLQPSSSACTAHPAGPLVLPGPTMVVRGRPADGHVFSRTAAPHGFQPPSLARAAGGAEAGRQPRAQTSPTQPREAPRETSHSTP